MGAIMKFITEDDLRDLYKKEPFMDYDLQPGERLTPGARQFLLDRGINLYDDDPFLNTGFKKSTSSKSSDDCEEKAAFDKQFAEKKHKWALAGLKAQLEEMESSLSGLLDEQQAQAVSSDLCRVINTLSQMIYSESGGKECQKD